MTTVSGDLRLVTNQPALVSQAWVRAVETRADGAGVIVDDLAPVMVAQGRIEFECAPGVAVLVLAYAGGVPAKTIPLVVAGETQSLGDAVRAGQGVDGATQSALDSLREDIAQTLADIRAEASAVDSTSAEVGEQLTALAADAASSADAAAASATQAGEHAGAAAASASEADASEQAAAASATQAGEHAGAAGSASDSASASAQAAAESATLAGEHAGAAGESASAASASEQAAASSADAAASAAADASTKAIADKVNELTRDAPEAFDTLAEIAAELEQNESDRAVLTQQLASKASVEHTHVMGDVEGLGDALAGKAPTTHTHSTSQVSGLDDALAGKAPVSHTHTTGEITGLDSALAQIPKIQVVDAVPESPDEATLYLVREA